ncbi:MAG: hypothetical protein JXB45_08275 [Candidatus Krumholzibacteriota bacterium]|nr:hypothetical protein [Candidatus Krumholzibacteriota bacterium]
MGSNKPVKVGIIIALALLACSDLAVAQSVIDTMTLTPLAPDSFYIRREGGGVLIGWYPPSDEVSTIIGSRDYRNWYSNYQIADVSQISFSGYYIGDVDRTMKIERKTVDTVYVGVDPSIEITFEVDDQDQGYDTYTQKVDIGADHYTVNDPIPLVLVGRANVNDTLRMGASIHFGPGMIGSDLGGGGLANARIDFQDFEGFHVFRGISPYPSEMQAIKEIDKEDYFRVGYIKQLEDVPYKWKWLWEYFRDEGTEPAWPRYDNQGRKYYEWRDNNVFAGFTYYYIVTCYDRGYFNGFFQHNKEDSYICDSQDDDPDSPLNCKNIALKITMTVDAGNVMKQVYAVPNPFRTGTSAGTSPYYHNYKPVEAIEFYNIPSQATLKIFTVSGDLVWESTRDMIDESDGTITWNVRNMGNQDVGSGVYVFKCERKNGDYVYGRVVVIR